MDAAPKSDSGAGPPARSSCPGCGLLGVAADGPVDPYGGSSAACWEAFGAVTLRDYGELRYPAVHRLIVDAYMSQHAMFDAPAARRSVIVHLVGLHLVLERGMRGPEVGRALGAIFPDKRDPAPIGARPAPGGLTVAHVLEATDGDEHARRGRAWAASVWNAWSPAHAAIRALGDQLVSRAPVEVKSHGRRR